MSTCPIRVVKVGGSLLDLADLSDRIRRWLDLQSSAHHVLVAGGGPLVDVVRQWRRQQPLSEAAAHWMCIDLMTVTAHLLHACLPEIWLEEDDNQLCRRVGERGATIFGPARWLRHAEPKIAGTLLRPSWDTTSDAIAGRLAVALGACELALLKSTSPPGNGNATVDQLAKFGIVDAVLPKLSAELPPVHVVNLRSESW